MPQFDTMTIFPLTICLVVCLAIHYSISLQNLTHTSKLLKFRTKLKNHQQYVKHSLDQFMKFEQLTSLTTNNFISKPKQTTKQ